MVGFNEPTISKLIDAYYSDIRSMVVLLQDHNLRSGEISDDIFSYKAYEAELYDLIMQKKISAVRKMIVDKGFNIDSIYRGMFDKIVPRIDGKAKQSDAIIMIADYMHQSVMSIDKEITFCACIHSLIRNEII
jgi:hypothetical protein